MSASLTKSQTAPASSPKVPVACAPVRRDAFYLPSQGQPLFAWLHTASDQPCLDHGVIICSPIGYEQLHAHRSLRHLADNLANQRIPTLRFDWHGTGDSAGIDEDLNRCATWQTNLHDAVNWMRNELGCKQVSIVGLRLGGLIAALATEEIEVSNLILWSPVTNGRAYVREMTAIELTAEFRPGSNKPPTGDIEAGGFVLSKMTAAELSQLNLLKSHPWCQRALIVGRSDAPVDHRLHDRCASLGFPVEQLQVPGYLEMMAEPHQSHVPVQAIQQITQWIHKRIQSGATGDLQLDQSRLASTEAFVSHRPESSSFTAADGTIRERAIRLSTDPDLFGILSEPAVEPQHDLPAIIVLNSGSANHVGPGRLHVHVTRQLASRGFRCLRMDISGLGDSVTVHPELENVTYPATAFRDVELAIQTLRRDFGVQRCILMGLCSGAYAAFQSAASIADPAIVESVLINPLTFFWKDGMSMDATPVGDLVEQHYYLGSALQPKKWLKLFTGRTEIGLLGAFRVLSKRLKLTGAAQQQSQSDHTHGTPLRSVGHPVEDNLPTDLTRIANAGRSLAMFFAVSDPGYSILMHKARTKAQSLRKAGRLQVEFLKEADHTFSRRSARTALLESLQNYLCSKYS